MEAPSYPFSQKIWAAWCNNLASLRSKRESIASWPFVERPLRPINGSPDKRVSTFCSAIGEGRTYRTFVRIYIIADGCPRVKSLAREVTSQARALNINL